MRRIVAKSQPWRYANSGMTLIEMLVALAIFAVLGIMGYRAAAMAMETRQRVAAEMQRWRDIANLVQVLETDAAQFVERPGASANVNAVSMQMKTIAAGVEFSFLKLDGSGNNVRRRGYRFEDGRIVQLRWPGTDSVALPEAYPLLERVTAMRCAVIGENGQRFDVWPGANGAQVTNVMALDVELELPDAGTIRRLIAIR